MASIEAYFQVLGAIMNGILLPPPPGFEPPELSLKFLLLSVLFMVVTLFGAVCLAAVQSERKRTKEPRKPDTVA